MKEIKSLLTLFGGVLGAIMGELNGFLIALIVFVCVDYITGVMSAICEKKLNSETGYKGIFKKVCIFMIVAIANVVDCYIIKEGSTLRTATIFFYLSNEGISIMENAAKIGLPVPTKLKQILEQIGEDNETKNNGTKRNK